MTMIFDGKTFAKNLEAQLAQKVKEQKAQGINPYFVSILASSDPASQLYVRLKKETAERVGIKAEMIEMGGAHVVEKIQRLIGALNIDDEVNGIMVQLPLGLKLRVHTQKILSFINSQKDVDGLTQWS